MVVLVAGDRGRLLSAATAALPVPVVVYASIEAMTLVPDSIPAAGWQFFWVLVVIWLTVLPALLIKSVNIGILRLAGARLPAQGEWQRLREPWQQVLARSGSRPGRYLLLVTDRESPVHRDLGLYAVVVSWEWARELDDDELAGMLAQRLARQTNAVAPLVGLCAWATVPLALVLACGVVLYWVVRTIGKAIFGGVKEAPPKNEGEARIALFFVAVAFIMFVLSLIIGLMLLVEAVVAIAVGGVALWLARIADVSSDNAVVRWGYRHQLRAALVRLDATGREGIGWRQLISTRAPVRAHLKRMRQSVMP